MRMLIAAVIAITMAGAAAAGPAAQAQQGEAPDFTKFGFPTAAASADFTPGTATSVSAGGHTVKIPADFLSKPVTFELLTGDSATFAPYASGRQVVAAFAFRVTDKTTNTLVGAFDKPVAWSFSGPGVTTQSAVFDTSASTPPTVVPNGVSPGAVSGTSIAHPFKIATVGWLVSNGTAPAAVPATGTGDGAGGTGDSAATAAMLAALLLALGVTGLATGRLAYARNRR
jgi:hypothetical protein